MSELLNFAQHKLQLTALAFFAVVYLLKARGYSLNGSIPRPEGSSEGRSLMVIQFLVLHLGVVVSLALSFFIAYWPRAVQILEIQFVFQFFLGAAFIVGVMRIIQRAANRYSRITSSVDDYFSLILLAAWFALALAAVSNDISGGEGIMIAYFLLTAFFLIYAPFSRMSKCVFYPLTGYLTAIHNGRRRAYSTKRSTAYKRVE